MNASFRDALTTAIRFWERGRIIYNVALFAVVATVFDWRLFDPGEGPAVAIVQVLFVLCVLANVAYCAAYPVDLLVQSSGYRTTWTRVRWIVLAIGILFACVIAEFVARFLSGRPV